MGVVARGRRRGGVGGVLINEVADAGVGLCVDAMFYPFCLLHFYLQTTCADNSYV